MKNLLSLFIAFVISIVGLGIANASELDELTKKFSYYEVRKEIACRNYDTNDARCFWNKVELVYAKEIVGRADIDEYLTGDELGRISKKIGFLVSRYEKLCENTEEPAKFCPAVSKLIDRGNYFLSNDQKYLPSGSDPLNSEYADGVMKEHCAEDWPDDFSMRVFCEGEQDEGLDTLKEGKPSDISGADFEVVREHCYSDWPSDYEMWAFCEGEEYDAIRTLEEGRPDSVSTTDFNTIRNKCASDWSDDFGMRVFCEDQQYDALKELESNSSNSYLCSSDVYNCSSFNSHSEAQSAYEYCFVEAGYDVHKLDFDNNGDACESL